MKNQNDEMLELLKSNRGFTRPEKWIEYGIANQFRRIKAEKLEACPDCNSQSSLFIGQFIYYSTLVNLKECADCALIFTDTRIDPGVIQTHFEKAYKDEEYFLRRRRRIFDQISSLADSIAPHGGKILDIGGAKGDLLATIKEHRPDLELILNDLSREACNHAETKHGLQTISGGINELENMSTQFDVIILSDVIYYESEIRKLWSILPRLVSKNGSVIIRVPNKLSLIRFWQFMRNLLSGHSDNNLQDEIKFFNPEHLFIFSRYYLMRRMKKLGFHRITLMPSELLINNCYGLWQPLYFYLCKILYIISFGKIIATPSLLVIAKRHLRPEIT